MKISFSKKHAIYAITIEIGLHFFQYIITNSIVITGSNQQDFGMTTPRKSSEPPVLNKRLGIYQRPMSAHGVRNQQDSTFSLAGK